jgi:hypothetical protein
MAERKNITGYSSSWTQPYLPTSYNPFYQSVESRQTELELDRLDAVDILVDEMLTYPDAERILNKIRQQGDHK